MTVQLKPHFLPRLIISPPTTPFIFTEPKETTLKTQDNDSIRFALVWFAFSWALTS